MNRSIILLVLVTLGNLAREALLPAAPTSRSQNGDGQAVLPPFHAELRAIAAKYKDGLYATPVDGHMPRWAPLLCRVPLPGKDFLPSAPRVSASKDTDTHGQKLYFLYAKDQCAYLDLGEKPVPIGQFIVKESWTAEEYLEPPIPIRPGLGSPVPFTIKDGKKYKPGKLASLFIMLKLDPQTSDTDNGWVYGTVQADGPTVTAAGRMESCMSCHEKAKHDRLFGLPQEDVQRVKQFIERSKTQP